VGVIEVHGLHKDYRRLRGRSSIAVAGLDLDVPEGGVFGFLGPNGSGKTTTIRCLIGLVRPTRGTTRLLGATSRTQLAGVFQRVGSIVETPTLFPGFSARRNLELLGRLNGITRRRVTEVLDQVGLGSRAADLVKTYSLGMKQRLGIGAALLKNPEVLILDEPANGLDPAGLKEVRDLLRRLGDEGRTIFLSSHLLGEVQQICDHVAILSRGRCIASGPVDEVLAKGRSAAMLVRVADPAAGLSALTEAGLEAASTGDESIRVNVPAAEGARITRALAEHGIYLSELRPDVVNLETVFLELTGETGETGAIAVPPPPPPPPPQ